MLQIFSFSRKQTNHKVVKQIEVVFPYQSTQNKMAGTAYHMEALRKTRVIERKSQAMQKLKDSLCQSGDYNIDSTDTSAPLVFSEPGHFAQNRSSYKVPSNTLSKDEVVFEEVVHDPNFKYRILKESGNIPMHVDPIYKIMYPGGVCRK